MFDLTDAFDRLDRLAAKTKSLLVAQEDLTDAILEAIHGPEDEDDESEQPGYLSFGGRLYEVDYRYGVRRLVAIEFTDATGLRGAVSAPAGD